MESNTLIIKNSQNYYADCPDKFMHLSNLFQNLENQLSVLSPQIMKSRKSVNIESDLDSILNKIFYDKKLSF